MEGQMPTGHAERSVGGWRTESGSCQVVGYPAWTMSCSAEEGEGAARYQIYSGQQLAHASMFSKCRALWRACILWHEAIYYRLVLWVNNFLLQNNRVGLTQAPRTEAIKRVNKTSRELGRDIKGSSRVTPTLVFIFLKLSPISSLF